MFFPQQMTSCFPLASMAQKNSSSPNDAEIGPIVPKQCAFWEERRSRRRIRYCRMMNTLSVCMVGLGIEDVSWVGLL